MTIHGIVPGPKVMTERPDLFLGNDRLDVDRQSDVDHHQPALIGIWVKFLQIPYRWLYS
jgi:TctA family transporter